MHGPTNIRYTDTLLVASKETGLEAKAEKT